MWTVWICFDCRLSVTPFFSFSVLGFCRWPPSPHPTATPPKQQKLRPLIFPPSLESTSGTRTPRLLYIPRCVYLQTHYGLTRIWRVLQEGLAECIANENGERQIACAIAFHGEEIVRPGSLCTVSVDGLWPRNVDPGPCGCNLRSTSILCVRYSKSDFFFLAVCGQPSYASTS